MPIEQIDSSTTTWKSYLILSCLLCDAGGVPVLIDLPKSAWIYVGLLCSDYSPHLAI